MEVVQAKICASGRIQATRRQQRSPWLFPENESIRIRVNPILQKLFNCEGRGLVSNVNVPPGRGKTTAAMAFLTAFKKKVRGIAICGTHGSARFVDEMAELLGNPPNGWQPCLVDALNSGDEDTRKTFLILDEYSGRPGASHGNN